MAEQNVVKISETADEAKGAPPARCLSELVVATMSKAAARLSSVDQDPIFREATARAGIRDFALALEGHFPEMRPALADHFKMMGAELEGRSDTGRGKSAAGRTTGGSASADHRKSSGVAGG